MKLSQSTQGAQTLNECMGRRESSPKIITICGSTRFKDEYNREIKRLTLEGNIVLSCPFFDHTDLSDKELSKDYTALLSNLHRRKIDLSNAILVINPGGYIGSHTMSDIIYASSKGKEIIYLEVETERENVWFI